MTRLRQTGIRSGSRFIPERRAALATTSLLTVAASPRFGPVRCPMPRNTPVRGRPMLRQTRRIVRTKGDQ